jgi:predicted membrane protein
MKHLIGNLIGYTIGVLWIIICLYVIGLALMKQQEKYRKRRLLEQDEELDDFEREIS